MRQAVEAAELMGHGVHVAESGVVEGHARHVLGVGHALAGLHVLAVGHGLAQILGNEANGLFRAGVGHGRSVGGHVRFDSVRQRVHACGGGQRRRHPHHEQGVVDGHVGRQEPVHDGHLHMAFLVGDHAKARHFRGRARRGIDGDVMGQHVVDLVHALVLVNRPAVGKQNANALAAVV